MKIYVSGKYDNKPTIKKIIIQLQSLGHTITHDWTMTDVKTELQNNKDHDVYPKYAINDVIGVTQARLLIAIMDDPEYAYRGTFTEIGVALGQRAKDKHMGIWIFCPHHNAVARTNPFFHHPYIVHFRNWQWCLEALKVVSPILSSKED